MNEAPSKDFKRVVQTVVLCIEFSSFSAPSKKKAIDYFSLSALVSNRTATAKHELFSSIRTLRLNDKACANIDLLKFGC